MDIDLKRSEDLNMPVLKNLSFLSKYFIFSITFIVLILLTLLVLDLETIVVIAVVSSLFLSLILTGLFINHEIKKPFHDLKTISSKLAELGETNINPVKDDLELKINELENILEVLKMLKEKSSPNIEILALYETISAISNRIISELSTAKTFKVNRNEFLGNVAHELRTPIFAIQLSLETLIDGAIEDEKVNIDFLERANRQADRLKELVDDLISISKIETGMKLSKRYFKQGDYIKGIIAELKDLSDNKNVKVTFEDKTSEDCEIFADGERLKQVFINLIENAIKYTSEDGNVIVRAIEKEKSVLFEIEDNGIGIPEKDIPRIFERFYRVDKNRSRDRGGSGLGLSIVKHIVEIHSSNITVESQENKGSVFRFEIQK